MLTGTLDSQENSIPVADEVGTPEFQVHPQKRLHSVTLEQQEPPLSYSSSCVLVYLGL